MCSSGLSSIPTVNLVVHVASGGSSSGLVSVGKISFNVRDVIGKGCEGTFVYK